MSHEKIGWDKVTVEGTKPVEKSEGEASIEAKTEKIEREIGVNTAMLSENIAQLPEPGTVSVEEHPGLREKLSEYKESLLRNKEFFMTKLGLGTAGLVGPLYGVIASQGGLPNMPATLESGIGAGLTVATVGLFVAGLDQIATRINVYLETKEHKEELLGLRKRHL